MSKECQKAKRVVLGCTWNNITTSDNNGTINKSMVGWVIVASIVMWIYRGVTN